MITKLQAWSAGAIEMALLLAAAAVPVFVNFYGFHVFDLGKNAVVVSLALAVAVIGLVALIEGAGSGSLLGLTRALRRPLVAAAGLLALTTALATATSITPRLSLLGSQERAQGLVALLAVLALFGAAAWLARDEARRGRIVGMLLAGSVPVALYAVTQALGLEVVPGKVESASRVFGTIANPIFLGAYLMLLWPLALARVWQAVRDDRPVLFAGYAAVALLQLAALLLAGSRGPLFGLVAGLVVLVMAGGLASGRHGVAWGALGLVVAGAIFLALFNVPNSPLAPLRGAPVIGRFGRISETSSGSEAARLRIWRSVGRLLAGRPARLATGHGPEALKYALIPYAETYVAGRGQAGRLVDRSHNVLLDALAMTGILGALALLSVYGAWLWSAAVAAGLAPTAPDRRRLAMLLAAGTGLGASSWLAAPLYAGALTLLGLVAGLIVYFAWALVAGASRPSDAPADSQESSTDATRRLALALLAVGAAAVVEAAFGIQTVVTQVVFWMLAGVVVAVGAGDRIAAAVSDRAPAGVPRQRSRRSREHAAEPEPGGVTITWSAGGAALGMVAGAVLGLIVNDFVLYGTGLLADTLTVVVLLGLAALAAGWLVATDVGESRVAFLIVALIVFGLYVTLRVATWVAAQDASWVYAATVLWLVALVPVGGWWLRGAAAPNAPLGQGAVGILYPLLAIPAGVLVWVLAIQPVRADIYFQSAGANFDAAVKTDDATLFNVAEELFGRATRLNPREDVYYLLWGERYTRVGTAAADVTVAAPAFDKAQKMVAQAETLDPLMPYHTFNRGHLQLLFAQKLEAGSKQSIDAAANAAVALQQVFDKVPYDPQVANELALAKLVAGDSQGAIKLLEYSREQLDARNGQTYRLLGQAYYATDQTDKALEALQKAVAPGTSLAKQERFQVQLMLAEIARERGDLDTAIDHYEQLLAGGAGDWRILFNLGLVYRDKGNFEKSLAALSQTLQAAPDDASVRAQIQQALDSVLAKQGRGAIPGGGGGLP